MQIFEDIFNEFFDREMQQFKAELISKMPQFSSTVSIMALNDIKLILQNSNYNDKEKIKKVTELMNGLNINV